MRWGKAERKTFNFSFKILISNFRFFSSRCCRCRCMWDGFGRRLFLFFLFRIQKYFPRSIVMSRAAGMMMLKRSQQRACGYYKIMDRKMIYVGAYTWIFFSSFWAVSLMTSSPFSVMKGQRWEMLYAIDGKFECCLRMFWRNFRTEEATTVVLIYAKRSRNFISCKIFMMSDINKWSPFIVDDNAGGKVGDN